LLERALSNVPQKYGFAFDEARLGLIKIAVNESAGVTFAAVRFKKNGNFYEKRADAKRKKSELLLVFWFDKKFYSARTPKNIFLPVFVLL
jgi:hypothetical protein